MSASDAYVLAIDPGPETSGVVLVCRSAAAYAGFSIEMIDADASAPAVRTYIQRIAAGEEVVFAGPRVGHDGAPIVAVEAMMPYGARVGMETFDTLMFIGELRLLTRQAGREARLINRHEVKRHICLSTKANDADIVDALRRRFGQTKATSGKKGSPLYGVKSHCWQALALAVTFLETPDIISTTVVPAP